jgi:hypothetical protein
MSSVVTAISSVGTTARNTWHGFICIAVPLIFTACSGHTESGAISSMFGSKELPNALSCSTNEYPSAFDKGMLVFGDLGHDGVQSAGFVATAPLTGRTYLGTSSVDKTDRVLTMQGVAKPDGSTDAISGTMRLHLVSSEGADRYKLDLTVAGEKAPTHWLCVGPVAQKRYAQEFHAKQAASPPQAEASPEQQQVEPSRQQQMEWIVHKIASNGNVNSSCPLIAQNIQTLVQATGVYDSPTIDKMLYTARQIGCI